MGFQQGLSGLNVSAKALDVIGNNVSNASTVGFKASATQFADVYAASLTGASTASAVGVGAAISRVNQVFTQGNLTVTSNPLDVAINGGGFFVLSDNGTPSYTRNGQFMINKEGFLVNTKGLQVMGYPAVYGADPRGVIVQSTPQAIFIDPSDINPATTTTMGLGVNLDSRVAPTNSATTFDPENALSFNSSTSITLYDSLGNPHTLTMFFANASNVAGGEWNVFFNVDNSSTAWQTAVMTGAGPALTTPAATVQGDPGAATAAPMKLAFDTSGNLVDVRSFDNASIKTNGQFSLRIDLDALLADPAIAQTNSAAQYLDVDIDFATCTQFGSPFGVNSMTQNGYQSGRLSGLNVASDGTIQARYSNGQSRNIAQVVLAKFTNPNGLTATGNNQWIESADSGAPLVGAPASGNLGVLQSGAIEEANLDLTAELVAMITQQRTYQANAQTIKTQDSILQTLVNLR